MADRTLIAVVDDEPGWLALVGTMLSDQGFHAQLLGDAGSALAQIVKDDPAVVILGETALAWRLRNTLGDACPVLLLVTGDLGELREDDVALFQAAYEKPASLQRILGEVRRAVRGRRCSGTVIKAQPEVVTARRAGNGS